mmetsp:Transcript_7225/g.11991  ORF Transcript_7225/g.11991 Transcript_7225/m.11991 type:complete len:207 (+) Transcript_7225:105-725(+)
MLRRSLRLCRAGHIGDCVGHGVVFGVDHGQAFAQSVDVDAVGHLKHVRHVVADQDDRNAARFHVLDQFQHLAAFLHPKGGSGFVQDDHLGAKRSGTGHGDALTLTARERLDRLFDVLDCHQPEFRQLVAGKFLHCGAVQLTQDLAAKARFADLTPHEHVVGDRQGRRHGQRLIDRFDPMFAGVDGRGEIHPLPVQIDFALVRDHGP